MGGYVLSQLQPSELYILSCGKGLGPSASAFSTAKNVELLGLYPIIRRSSGGARKGFCDIRHPNDYKHHCMRILDLRFLSCPSEKIR